MSYKTRLELFYRLSVLKHPQPTFQIEICSFFIGNRDTKLEFQRVYSMENLKTTCKTIKCIYCFIFFKNAVPNINVIQALHRLQEKQTMNG
jgi:hypothetical protein